MRKWTVTFLAVIVSVALILPTAFGARGLSSTTDKLIELNDVVFDASSNRVSGIITRVGSVDEAVLIVGVYDQTDEMVDLAIETVNFANEETVSFDLLVDTIINPTKHIIKLLVWDNLDSKQSLSAVTEINPYQLTEWEDELVHPYFLFVGKVVRNFTEGDAEARAVTIDASQFIDEENKLLRSVTGELEWDYDLGLSKLDAAKGQAVTGVLNATDKIELTDVIIRSDNEFGTIAVVSLDEQPISISRKLLIQAFTDNKPYGFESEEQEDGSQLITDIGVSPMNVRHILGSVVLKNISDIENVYVLDETGRVREAIVGTQTDEGYEIQLPTDSLYTLVERTGLDDPYVHRDVPEQEAVYVWWEGEDTVERRNFPATSDFDANTFPETRHLLSGGDWLAYGHTEIPEGQEPYARYEIEVPEDGEYSFFIRKFWFHGPFVWRFNDGEWNSLGTFALLDSVTFRLHLNANWISQGSVYLTKGTHSFEIELLRQPGSDTAFGLDAFLLTKQPFTPNLLLRPGEKLGLENPGYWAFEPNFETFVEGESLIDLSWLNEDVAGESGFVRHEGENLVLGDGRKVRFWGVNGGTDIVNMNKSQKDYFAKWLAKYGVNMFRIHGMLFDDNGEITDERLDNIHYLVHALKQEGIYTNLSYYFVLWSDMRNSEYYTEAGSEFSQSNRQPFGLLLFSEPQKEMYKEGVRRLMLSPNPYEDGLPLALDPAIGNIEVQNEDSFLFWTFNPGAYPQAVRNELYGKFGQWLVDYYGSLDAAYDSWGRLTRTYADNPQQLLMEVEGIGSLYNATGTDGNALRRRDTLRFLIDTTLDFYTEMVDFLRDEIGSQSVISASNWITAHPQRLESLERYSYTPTNLMDRHAYFEANHTSHNNMSYSVQEGDSFRPEPAVKNPGKMPVKFVHNDGHPSMISEITWTNPTPYTAEGPFFMSVYSSLQGIDAMMLFTLNRPAWSSGVDKWPYATPGIMGQNPAFALLYRTGAVAEAQTVAQETLSVDSLLNLKGSKIYEGLNVDDMRK